MNTCTEGVKELQVQQLQNKIEEEVKVGHSRSTLHFEFESTADNPYGRIKTEKYSQEVQTDKIKDDIEDCEKIKLYQKIEEHEKTIDMLCEANDKYKNQIIKLLEVNTALENTLRDHMRELDSKKEVEGSNQCLSDQIELLQVQFIDQQAELEKVKEDHQLIIEDLQASEKEIIERDEEIENLLQRIHELEENHRDTQCIDTLANLNASTTQITQTKDIPVEAVLKQSELDMKLMECLSKRNCTVPFEKLDDQGNYKFRTMEVSIILVNEKLMVRSGGGYIDIEDFILHL